MDSDLCTFSQCAYCCSEPVKSLFSLTGFARLLKIVNIQLRLCRFQNPLGHSKLLYHIESIEVEIEDRLGDFDK